MQPHKILIADDELLARQAIKLALPADDTVRVVAECADGMDAIASIRQLLPDIIFLDIQMPNSNGIEVLEAMPAGYEPYLVIVSAHDNYALAAYEHDAADYLLKPFSQERFDKVFKKAMKYCAARSTNAVSNYRNRITVKNGIKITIVPCEEITFIETSGDYTTVHTGKNKLLHSESLTALEGVLDPALFVRTHRSYLVNTRFIKELRSHQNGDYSIILHTGQQLKLSRNYRERLQHLV